MKEQSIDALMRGKVVYEPPRYMKTNIAAKQLLQIIESKPNQLITEESLVIGLARIGCHNQTIISCQLKHMLDIDLGEPLHSLIIPGKLHPIEEEMLKIFSNFETK